MNDLSRPAGIGGGTLRDVLDGLEAEPAGVLAVVVETEGSTYRKPGALLLLGRSLRVGWLSGGCLEPELELAAQALHAGAPARVVAFNTRTDDDLVFGSASGCRGLLRVLLMPYDTAAPLVHALQALRDSDAPLQLELGRECRAQLGDRTWHWSLPLPADAGPWRVAVAAPPRLLLLGSGPEAAPLLGFARTLGWYVDVVEHRGRWAQHALGADVRHDAPPARAWAGLEPQRYAAALVMSHHYGNDLEHLQHLAQSSIRYIGLLGPPARRDELLAALGPEAAERLRPRLHAPVGLRLGGEGPEAIALAILAQLHAFQHGRGA